MEKSSLVDFALNILLPVFCVSCKKEDFLICPVCKNALTENRYFICPVCGRRDLHGRLDPTCRKKTGLTRFLGAPLRYENEKVRKIIHAFKYQRVKQLASPLTQILIEFLNKNNFNFRKLGNHLLVPVPLHNFKERERGFNQAGEIAKQIAEYYRQEITAKLLKKIKNTSNQADIKNKETRIKNLKGAFTCADQKYARGKIVILIDDVYTTGSTIKECALVLRAAGAREVWAMTVAK